jgi:DNA repair exonuclease SbcCD ATPase subunit
MIGYQDKINQILRGAETIKNMNETDKNGRLVKKWDVKDVEELKSLVEELEEVKLERDALWVKTQEDEREINDLRDVNNELKQLKKEAEAQDFLKQILVKDLEIMEQEIKILDAKIDGLEKNKARLEVLASKMASSISFYSTDSVRNILKEWDEYLLDISS